MRVLKYVNVLAVFALVLPSLSLAQVDCGGCGGIPPKKPAPVVTHVPAPAPHAKT